MGDENDRSIENKLVCEQHEEEKEEEKQEVIEIDEDEDELDEIEELEEMTPPRLSCLVGADGKKHYEILVFNDDISNTLKNKLEMIEPCSICYQPFSTRNNHRICSLPCGHLYGLSCIKRWLLQSSSGGKCPQCNTLCKFKDVRLIYASRVCASAHQKASSTRHFAFTKKGLTEFREHERLQRVVTEQMHAEDYKKLVDVVKHQFDVVNKQFALLTQGADLLTRAKELEQRGENLGQADALRRGSRALKWRARALGRRCDALGRRADVLKQRTDELKRRLSAFDRSSNLFYQMYKEHLAQQMNSKSCTCHKH